MAFRQPTLEELVEFFGVFLVGAVESVARLRVHAVKVLSVGLSSDLGDAQAH